MAEIKTKENPKVDVSGILSKEGDDLEKAAAKKPAAKKASDKDGKSSKKKHKHVHIEAHHDEQGNSKGFTVRHSGGEGPEVSYAAKDLDEVHDGLEEHMGEPNGDEGQEPSPDQQQQEPPQPMAQPTPQGA